MSESLGKVKKLIVSDLSGDGEGQKELVVKKMPLGRYAEFTEELAKIPKTVSGIVKVFFGEGGEGVKEIKEGTEGQSKEKSQLTNDDVIDAIMLIPSILAENWNDLMKLLSLASGVDEKDIKELDLDEAVQVVMAVVEVNNFFGISDRCRELMVKQGKQQARQQQRMTVPQKKRK